MKHERAPLTTFVGLQNFRAGDIGGHEVWRKLDAPELPVEQIGERLDHHRLGKTGHADEECVAARNEPREQKADNLVLSNEHRGDLLLKGLAALPQTRQSFFRRLDFTIHK